MSSEKYPLNENSPLDKLMRTVQKSSDEIVQSELDYEILILNSSPTEQEKVEAFKVSCEKKLIGYCSMMQALKQSQDDVIINSSSQKQIDFMMMTSQLILQVESAINDILLDIKKNFSEEINTDAILERFDLSYLTE